MTVASSGPTRSQRYRVSHRTVYSYSAEMMDGYSVANLIARPTPTQHVVSSQLTTKPVYLMTFVES